uniref:RING-type domain-containing protein n=1 Tax=Kalanchoe fedtschenkoi TaxID=63787 RepID=A0A7N0VEG3_KALFE
MVFDTIPPASLSHAKDLNKKKRANRSAKLKQCKLDARREQWLSQVKSKGAREDLEERCEAVGNEVNGDGLPLEAKLEVKPRGEEKGGGDGTEGRQEGSDSESSPLNSPGSVGSSASSGSNISGTTFAGSSVGSSGTCSGNVTEDDEEEGGEGGDESDGCVDDWEAIADALADNDKKHASNSDPPNEREFAPRSESSLEKRSAQDEQPKPQPPRALKFNRGTRAWRPDDAFRPRGLPNLSKQWSLPVKSGRYLGRGAGGFGSFNSSSSVASACDCPICYEELDVTDASFSPCPCGFRMCLFCYKRICEDDGRCPGCRKHYKIKESPDGKGSPMEINK